MVPASVDRISTSIIKPWPIPQHTSSRCELTLSDLAFLSVRYIQKGLLFSHKHPHKHLLEPLKTSLSRALFHFFPLAGRLTLEKHPSSSSLSISIACNSAGAEFIHAVASDVTVSDILTPTDVPSIVDSFFAFNGAVNSDGTSLPLLAVQLTELDDGFFLGCSFNHAVGDGSAFWHFFSSWAEISRSEIGTDDYFPISRPPVIQRSFPDHVEIPIRLPFTDLEEFIKRPPLSVSPLRDRFFHFTHESISRLKAKANDECKTDRISSFQALSAHVWRSMTRARCLDVDQETSCQLAIDTRHRLEPPLPRDYFGSAIQGICAVAKAGELLASGLGWAAWLVHRCVADHRTSEVERSAYEKGYMFFYTPSMSDRSCNVRTGSSPRFDVYGVDFGWGKAVAVRSGQDNKFEGKITAFPGREGGGSVDLEICLEPEVMCALESDEEFMDAVSVTPLLLSGSGN